MNEQSYPRLPIRSESFLEMKKERGKCCDTKMGSLEDRNVFPRYCVHRETFPQEVGALSVTNVR